MRKHASPTQRALPSVSLYGALFQNLKALVASLSISGLVLSSLFSMVGLPRWIPAVFLLASVISVTASIRFLVTLEAKRDGFQIGPIRCAWADVATVAFTDSHKVGKFSRTAIRMTWKRRPWWAPKRCYFVVQSHEAERTKQVLALFEAYRNGESSEIPAALMAPEGSAEYRSVDAEAIPVERLISVLRDPKSPTRVRVRAAESLSSRSEGRSALETAKTETVLAELEIALDRHLEG